MAAMKATHLHLSEQRVTVKSSIVSSSSRCSRGTFCGDNILNNSSFNGVKISFAPKPVHHARKSLTIEAAKKVSSARSYVLTATLVANEGSEEAAMKLCKGILAWAEEKKKDKKSGIISFECSVDAYEKNVFHFWERYESFPTMNDARSSKEHCTFMDQVRPLLASPVALAAYEYRDGKLGCMLNPIGPKGEGGLDDATGQGGSGGGASYKQTSTSVQQGFSETPKESKNVWGLQQALRLSLAKKDKDSEGEAEGVVDDFATVAQRIADGLASLFGRPPKKN